jgi:hypothetical protein
MLGRFIGSSKMHIATGLTNATGIWNEERENAVAPKASVEFELKLPPSCEDLIVDIVVDADIPHVVDADRPLCKHDPWSNVVATTDPVLNCKFCFEAGCEEGLS